MPLTQQNFLPAVLRFVQLSSTFGKRAFDQLNVKEASEKKAAALIPNAVKAMLDAGVIEPDEKQAAEQMLANHDKTIELLVNATQKIAQFAGKLKTAGISLGEGVDEEKVGSDVGSRANPQSSLTSPFVGQRTSEKKASDIAMFQGLGLGHLV